MEIRHLRYFKVLAEELHFGKAAKRLFISQPPLSRQIKELEEELEVQLLLRNNKRVVLTDAGNYYLTECVHILSHLEKVKHRCKQIHLAESGIFNLGYVSSISKKKLSEILKSAKKQYPLLQIHLFEISSQKQLKALEQGKLDIGIIRSPITRAGFSQIPLYEDGFVLAIPKSKAPVKTLSEIDFNSEHFITYNSDYAPIYYQKVLEVCSRLNFTPSIVHECNTMQSILELVGHDAGLAIVPRSVQQDYDTSQVYFASIENTEDINTQILMTYLTSNQSPALVHIAALIEASLK